MYDVEIESFKRLDFVGFAAGMGYQRDLRESSGSSHVLRDASGDKLVVRLGADGHWTYFSVRDTADCGTLVDFVQKRLGGTLGETRKAIRAKATLSFPTA
jgi:hypothetical protein